MEYELKRIHIWPVVKVVFIIFLILGLLLSLFYIFMLAIAQNFAEYYGEGIIDEDALQMVSHSSLILVMFLTVLYAIMASVFAVFFCALYNIIAGKTGGFSFTLLPAETQQVNETLTIEQLREKT